MLGEKVSQHYNETSCNPRDLLNFSWTFVGAGSIFLTANELFYFCDVDVLADPGRPLPTFRSALPVALIRLNKLSSPLLDQSLNANLFSSFFESNFSLSRVFN